LTFELVESDDDAPDLGASLPRATRPRDGAGDDTTPEPDDGPAHEPEPSPRPPRARPVRRRTVVAGVVALAVVAAGMLGVDAVRSRADLARLRAAPGAVEPLATAPVERWSVDAELTAGFALLPGAFATVEDGTVVARDLDSGDVRWRAEVEEGTACGGFAYWTLPTGEPDPTLVCLAPRTDGPSDAVPESWGVTVLDASGEVLGRRDLVADGALASAGPAGGVVLVERVGDPPTGDGRQVDIDPGSGAPTDLPTGRGVVVTVEDALTGEDRWQHALEFAPSAGGCVRWGDGGTMDDAYADLETVWAVTADGIVRVEGCGISAWFSADGTRLDDPDNPADGISPLADGSLYRDPTSAGTGWPTAFDPEDAFAPAILDPDGTVRWEPPGPVYVPQATDAGDDVVLVRDGIELVAFGTSGEELWRTRDAGTPDRVAVVAGGVVVVPQPGSDLVGLDVVTGSTLWTLEDEALREATGMPAIEGAGWSMDTMYTDGERAVVVVSDWESQEMTLVAVDLVDGSVGWHTEQGEPYGDAWLLPLQGRLFSIDETTLTRFG
jgi:hypothetical protein